MTDDIIIYKEILKAGHNFIIIVPKDMIEDGQLESYKKYRITFSEIPEKEKKIELT